MKKAISCITLISFLITFALTVSAENNKFEVVKYDYLTGESSIMYIEDTSTLISRSGTVISPEYNVPQNQNIIEPFVIIGNDDRVVVNPNNEPYCRVLCLQAGFDLDGDGKIEVWNGATGSMVYKDIMLTCAHSLYWYAYSKTAKELRVHIKQNGTTLNTNYVLPNSWILPSQYINSKDSDYDWSVIKLQSSIGDSLGWFGYGYATGSISNKSIATSGYPDIVGKRYKQYVSTGTMNSTSTYRYSMDADCEGGQSGSPVYDSNGIIWGGLTSEGTSLNYGCRITQNLYNTIENMK